MDSQVMVALGLSLVGGASTSIGMGNLFSCTSVKIEKWVLFNMVVIFNLQQIIL